MANWTEPGEQGQEETDMKGKFILDCAAYLTFKNKQKDKDKPLTEQINVTTANS